MSVPSRHSDRRGIGSRLNRRLIAANLLLAVGLALSACSVGDWGDDEEPTATEVAGAEAGTETATTPAEPSPTIATTSTARATPTTVPPTEPPAPTPTMTPIPSGPPPEEPTATPSPKPTVEPQLQAYPVPAGTRPHDVAPAVDGGVWYTGQGNGTLGWLDPATGEVREIRLGSGSAPHGVIVGPDGAPWITDGGLNAIVRVDPETDEVAAYPLPEDRPAANLNTATFDGNGVLWFTGQSGVYGRLDPVSGEMQVFDAPRGRGPYGITTTPEGVVYYASLAGSYVGRVDTDAGEITVLEPPTAGQGARRVWSDSQGRIWVSEWTAGQVAVYDPSGDSWQEWRLPGDNSMAYAVYVDDRDIVWLSDFGANALVSFDPRTEEFTSFPLPGQPGNVRQIHGRPGEVWAPESATDTLVVVRTR